MESINIFVTYIIFCIFRFDCLERLICGVEGAAKQPDRVINWARHIHYSHCKDLATCLLAIFISCCSVITGSSLKLEGILSRIIIFAKFDRASSSQTCPGVCGVFANAITVYNLQNVALQVAEFWCLHPIKHRAWGLSLKS